MKCSWGILLVVATLQPFAWYAGTTISLPVLVALLVCLIPTTIGALLSAIGIAGMDRLVQRNVLAMSGRAVEAAGDVNTLLLDKTGKLAPVKFQHGAHGKLNECKDCHEGDKPLFEQKRSTEGFKMADMHAGKNCGACHDGKDHGARKKVFSSKTCMKCHKK